jgi:hypothetical protein
MSKTADNLVYEVAGILGKAVAGEALGDVEYQTIDSNIDPVLAEIDDIIAITDRDEIPDRYFQTVSRLVAVHSAAKFSNAPVDLGLVQQHEDRLRYLSAQTATHETLKSEYY